MLIRREWFYNLVILLFFENESYSVYDLFYFYLWILRGEGGVVII